VNLRPGLSIRGGSADRQGDDMATQYDSDYPSVGEFIQEKRRHENVQYLVNLTQIYMISAPILLALISTLLALILWRLW
jgi:hypothetical protein